MSLHLANRGFETSEFENRVEKAQRLMAAQNINALFLSTEAEVRYFTGFLTQFWQSPTRPWFLIVPSHGKPIAVIPDMGRVLMEQTWITDIRTWTSPNPDDEGVGLVRQTLAEQVPPNGAVGVLKGPETFLRMPLNDFQRIEDRLSDRRFIDATSIVRTLRMSKSEAEINKIEHICGIASSTFEAIPTLVASEMPLIEVFRTFKIDLLTRNADDVPYLVGAAAAGGYSNVIAPPNSTLLKRGDVLMLDTGAFYDGYYCDFDRNFSIGCADSKTHHGYHVLTRATEASYEVARPGVTCADLFGAMKTVIAEAGYACGNVGRMGHGLGMQLTEWPSLTATDHTVLVEGMVLALEPSLSLGPEKTIVHEENIVIRQYGAQYLSRPASAKLPEINIS